VTSHVLDRADVVIVGAGTVGISTAFFLAEKGLDVVVLEREQVAWGASGRNAGFMWIHLRTPGIALDMCRAGFKVVEELATAGSSTSRPTRSAA
jgi:glycine/D-amino acid oxidase-like deaminating enzyme